MLASFLKFVWCVMSPLLMPHSDWDMIILHGRLPAHLLDAYNFFRHTHLETPQLYLRISLYLTHWLVYIFLYIPWLTIYINGIFFSFLLSKTLAQCWSHPKVSCASNNQKHFNRWLGDPCLFVLSFAFCYSLRKESEERMDEKRGIYWAYSVDIPSMLWGSSEHILRAHLLTFWTLFSQITL